ncbi:large ribosomal subunit protein uL29m-like [Lineus longissimus]|uniref:large ribosomal subunit protein uL29m-like n=1 Tax=Lineus longissimus TaxID=88925 RepID=UPI002B4C3685
MAAPIIRKSGFTFCRFFANSSVLRCVVDDTRVAFAIDTSIKQMKPGIGSLQPRCLHVSSCRLDLEEFFDVKKHWGATSIKTGRPWLTDELRLKTNVELHKLWYVLLKERNMLMTMEAEYTRQKELFPNPERMEKVEESMENIQEVVAERNRAYNVLETGKTGEPELIEDVDVIGRPVTRLQKEHYIPKHMNNSFMKKYRLLGPWVYKYLQLWREKMFNASRYREKKELAEKLRLKKEFPNADID